MGAYYHSINIGAFIAISSTFAEKVDPVTNKADAQYVGFWLAFLIPGVRCCYILIHSSPLTNH
jgi:hypothetical protein